MLAVKELGPSMTPGRWEKELKYISMSYFSSGLMMSLRKAEQQLKKAGQA